MLNNIVNNLAATSSKILLRPVFNNIVTGWVFFAVYLLWLRHECMK
jgi:hypothetical protein